MKLLVVSSLFRRRWNTCLKCQWWSWWWKHEFKYCLLNMLQCGWKMSLQRYIFQSKSEKHVSILRIHNQIHADYLYLQTQCIRKKSPCTFNINIMETTVDIFILISLPGKSNAPISFPFPVSFGIAFNPRKAEQLARVENCVKTKQSPRRKVR